MTRLVYSCFALPNHWEPSRISQALLVLCQFIAAHYGEGHEWYNAHRNPKKRVLPNPVTAEALAATFTFNMDDSKPKRPIEDLGHNYNVLLRRHDQKYGFVQVSGRWGAWAKELGMPNSLIITFTEIDIEADRAFLAALLELAKREFQPDEIQEHVLSPMPQDPGHTNSMVIFQSDGGRRYRRTHPLRPGLILAC
jgi:hypothetical protein